MKAEDIQLVRTCFACPEQYDAYDCKGAKIGYLLVRWGAFSVQCPDLGGDVIYWERIDGSGLFETHERDKYLEAAKEAIASYYNTKKQGGAE